MSNQDYIAPVNHGALSATASTTAGAVGGAFKGAASGLLKGIIVMAAIGGVIGLVWGLGSAGLLAFASEKAVEAVVMPAIVGQLGHVALVSGLCALAGGAIGAAAGYITVPVGGLIGMFKGASNASERVSNERSAAMQMQAQVEAYKAQAMAEAMQTAPYAPAANDNKYNFPPQGSTMNPAGTTLSSVQRDGALAGQQLQRAGA